MLFGEDDAILLYFIINAFLADAQFVGDCLFVSRVFKQALLNSLFLYIRECKAF